MVLVSQISLLSTQKKSQGPRWRQPVNIKAFFKARTKWEGPCEIQDNLLYTSLIEF